jgi:hypothetical protein
MTDAATKQLADLLQLPVNTVKAVLVLQSNRLALLRVTTAILRASGDEGDEAEIATQTRTFDLVPRDNSPEGPRPKLSAVPSSAILRRAT